MSTLKATLLIIVKNIYKLLNKLTISFSKGKLPNFGKGSFCHPTIKDGGGGLRVGNFCAIADSATIITGREHKPEWVSMYPFNIFYKEYKNMPEALKTKGDVIIGNDVWIGHNATILSGVTIGDGAVVGACSVVAKDIPPYAIVVGNPAKIIRFRFNQEIIDKLLELQWWNKPDSWIKENIHLLMSKNVEELLNRQK